MFFIRIALALCLSVVYSKTICPNNEPIYELGISESGKKSVLNAHNNFRLMIAQGVGTTQPKGTNLKRQHYDDQLGEEGRVVSLQCKMNHIIAKDSRWSWVGQNLFIEWSSVHSSGQNWKKAVDSWFNEQVNFTYPDHSKPESQTGHYTQVVWWDSNKIGCDFVFFYDRNKPRMPYAKLYTCNYGPGGNIVGRAPYSTSTSGEQCPNLC